MSKILLQTKSDIEKMIEEEQDRLGRKPPFFAHSYQPSISPVICGSGVYDASFAQFLASMPLGPFTESIYHDGCCGWHVSENENYSKCDEKRYYSAPCSG